jgi:hypothetical protein
MSRYRCCRNGLVLLLAACGGGEPEPVAPPEGFEHAYAAASCAPWDGYAVSLVLRGASLATGDSAIEAGDAPQLQLALYPRSGNDASVSRLPTGTYRWPSEPEMAVGAWCERGHCTTMRSGRITVREAAADGRLRGSVDVTLQDGRSMRGTFDAEWRPRRWFCI